ncbi:RraA family protein [Diaminobutyricibacter tongyongensis]|uniref:Putative 4-hydroxy-4-methyl-2-oxoglutarate aldolase n=1 Tax=Leifsonia tongyongensis TaxID=1268043 RepID=A0A6L9Y299_9MICO|nr:RraA family protein [Diaminobutyricibacter tongyongensis]NEN07801.1 RraA family protein [Diaminobutyricibacter tongyongensis]
MSILNNGRLRSVSAASLTDALGRLVDHRAHVLDLVSPTPGRVLFGQAVTIRFVPFRSDLFDESRHSFARHFYDAVPAQPSRTVLVLDSSGHPDVSVGGGTKFSRLQNLGLAGLVTDARLRDFDELMHYEPVFYCRGETVRAGTEALMPIAANVPVSLDGTTVVPGDYIYADHSGTVVIPAGLLDQVLDVAAGIETQDRAFLAEIRHEDPEQVRSTGSREG